MVGLTKRAATWTSSYGGDSNERWSIRARADPQLWTTSSRPRAQERPPILPAQQVDWTQYDEDEDDSFEVVSDVADEEQLSQPDRRLQHEGCHGAMAMPPPGPPGGDGNGDRDDPGRRERVRDYVPDPPAAEEEEEHPRSADTKRQRLARGRWLQGRGKGTKRDAETGASGSTIEHGALSPSQSWQAIYAKGLRPRQLFPHDQGGKSSGQSSPVLVGWGNTPLEQQRSVQIASATAKANQALQHADTMNETGTNSQLIAQSVQMAADAVSVYVTALQTGTIASTTQAGKGTGKHRMVLQRELEAHYAAKGKGTGKSRQPHDESLEGADGAEENGGEDAEEETPESDAEVNPDPPTTEATTTTLPATSTTGASAASTEAPTPAASSTAAGPSDQERYAHRILRDRNSQRIGEALWSGRYSWGMAPEWLPSDGSDVEDPSHAFNDDHIVDDGSEETATNVEQEAHAEQDTEVGNALPPRLKREDPEHKMMPGGHGLRPVGWTPGQRLQGDGGVGMAVALQPQQVQLAVTTLMQGRTIPLQYGRWVQWDQTSWVGSMHTYRYGVFYGLQVRHQVGLMLRRPVVPGVTHSLELRPPVGPPPKPGPPPRGPPPTQMATVEVESDTEEMDPSVPFEHGMVQPGRKPPPQAWFQRQNMQDWMNRMAKQPGGQQRAMMAPPPAPPAKAVQQQDQPAAAAHGVPQRHQGQMPTQPVPMQAYPAKARPVQHGVMQPPEPCSMAQGTHRCQREPDQREWSCNLLCSNRCLWRRFPICCA